MKGAKMWITNSPIADVFVVWAKLEDETARSVVRNPFTASSKGMKDLSAPKIGADEPARVHHR
jgi:glutaryl-CoA dehydrogenase